MKSLSEIDVISKRATKAAGYSWGIAEEVGKNIKLLELFGLPGVKNLNAFYKSKKKNVYKNLKLINIENKSPNEKLCPVITGLSFLDQIKTLESLEEIKFENIGYPILFIPFVSRASEVIGKRLLLKVDDKKFLFNFNINIYSNFLSNETIELAKNVLVKFIDNSDSFEQKDWEELYKLSENTFVEESESLKKTGAGAGLNDND